jgi:hypothetical protein
MISLDLWKYDNGGIECADDNLKVQAGFVITNPRHIPKLSFTNLIFPFIHFYHSTFITLVLGFGL